MSKQVIFFLLFLSVSSCHVGRYFYWNFADINDHKKFAYRTVAKSDAPFSFVKDTNLNQNPIKRLQYKKGVLEWEKLLDKSKTIAFLIIQDDTVRYEYFRKNYDEASLVPSFSMAKSFVSTLVGIALEEGKIKSIHDPITNYLPYLDSAKFGRITIEHLLNMRSGIQFNESYFNPFGDVAKAYYGTNLKKLCRDLKIKQAPDQAFDYISINTQLLAFIVEEATGKKIDAYLQEKIWKPLGTEFDATWSIDSKKQGNVKGFSSLNATAYDFAKLGRLMLREGNWNGKQLISSQWVKQALESGAEKNDRIYSYQWWIFDYYRRDNGEILQADERRIPHATDPNRKIIVQQPFGYAARGILDQFVYFNPKKKCIIVRLGSYDRNVNWPMVFNIIASNGS